MIVDWYARHGYHFLALSDHNVLGQGQKWMSVAQADKRAKHDGFARYRERFGDAWVETRTVDGDEQVRLKPLGEYRTLFERPGQFLLIQGEEITDKFETKPIHMNASNLLELIKPQGGKSVCRDDGQQPRRRRGAGPAAGPPHPGPPEPPQLRLRHHRRGAGDGHEGAVLRGLQRPPRRAPLGRRARTGVERMWDILMTRRLAEFNLPILYGLAVDDGHNYHDLPTRGADPGRGWVHVLAKELTAAALIEALEAGRFYSFQRRRPPPRRRPRPRSIRSRSSRPLARPT